MCDQTPPCDSVVLLRLIYAAATRAGLDAEQLRKEFGVTDAVLSDHNFRFPHELQVEFWQYLESHTNDPCIGLKIGQHLPIYQGQVIEYFFYSSKTFGEALKRVEHFHRIITDAISFKLEEHGDHCQILLEHKLDEGTYLRHFMECLVIGICRFFSAVLEVNFSPTFIEFEHQQRGDIDQYEKIMDCPVRFNCAANTIGFSTELLSQHSLHAEPDLEILHEAHAVQQLQRLMRRDLILQMEAYFHDFMGKEDVSLTGAARELVLSVRQLRQELSEAGTSFNQLYGDYRCRLAKQHLASENVSIEDIVVLTGFSEPSTFYRAFKRWTGRTPLEYRKSKLNSAVTA